jgi:hypothetical protein
MPNISPEAAIKRRLHAKIRWKGYSNLSQEEKEARRASDRARYYRSKAKRSAAMAQYRMKNREKNLLDKKMDYYNNYAKYVVASCANYYKNALAKRLMADPDLTLAAALEESDSAS